MPINTDSPRLMGHALAVCGLVSGSACADRIFPLEMGENTAATDSGVSSSTGSTASEPGGSSTAGVDETGTETTGEFEPPPERVALMLEALTTALYECPERIWQDDNAALYRERQVLLVSVEDDLSWLWNDQQPGDDPSPRVTTRQTASLSLPWRSSAFEFGVFERVRTLGISLDLSQTTEEASDFFYIDQGTQLAFHEAFHWLGSQDGWGVVEQGRRAPYPQPWVPRYLKAEIATALRSALETNAPLGAAAHWLQRMQAEHPADLEQYRSLHVLEGSAQYATIVSSVLATLGCDVTEDELVHEATANLDRGFFIHAPPAAIEPYQRGMLAGLLLRRDGVVGWEAAVESGTPPLELLLDGVVPIAQPNDATLEQAIEDQVAAENAAIGMEVEPMLEHLGSAAHLRMAVSSSWFSGSFQTTGIYSLPQLEAEPDVYVALSATVDVPSGAIVELVGETSLVGVSTPCAVPPDSVVLTMSAADVTVVDGLATSLAPSVAFAGLPVEQVQDPSGLPWLCPGP